MKKAFVILANGFEEVEALTPVDVLRRAGIACEMVSINEEKTVCSTHIVKMEADSTLDEINPDEYDMIILPGGMPGAKYLSEDERVINIIKNYNMQGKYIAAICASPALVLSRANVVDGKKVTCYPGMEGYLSNSNYSQDIVVQDGNIITSRGPATAMEFAYKIVDVLGGRSREIREGMLYNLI